MIYYKKDEMIATYRVDETWEEVDDELIETPFGMMLKQETLKEEFINKLNAFNEKIETEHKISEKKARLDELTKDFAQVDAGLEIADIEERRAEFRKLLNEVRALQGKEPRKRKGEQHAVETELKQESVQTKSEDGVESGKEQETSSGDSLLGKEEK